MRRFVTAFAAVALMFGCLAQAEASVLITVDKSTQELTVSVDGAPRYTWPVSTARRGYHTPNGTYRPQRLARKWYSRKYDMSPMPYSIFFHGGYAIHGSYESRYIGRPASHGCVRLHPKDAAKLFALVKAHRDDTKIVVTGERPSRARLAHHRERFTRDDYQRRAAPEPENFEDIFGGPFNSDAPEYRRAPRRWEW
ncbi:MAG TPA: L,D-transpeptidase [Pseudolabrys sp.]|nr:L,D-transpeptidase [Pseudolabrys sp.]